MKYYMLEVIKLNRNYEILLNRVSSDQRKVCVQGQLAARVQARAKTPAVVHGSYILSFILVLLLQ